MMEHQTDTIELLQEIPLLMKIGLAIHHLHILLMEMMKFILEMLWQMNGLVLQITSR